MCQKLLSFLKVSLSKQRSTHQCYFLAVHGVAESVRGDCRFSGRPRIKNRQRLKSLLQLSQRLKSLVRDHAKGCKDYVARKEDGS